MKSLKKALLTVSAFLLATVQCLSFAACGNETAKRDGENKTAVEYEEASPYGIYTDLQFSLNGENGLVRAAIKNKFTLFPSTVTVNLELYRSDNYSESFEEMTLSASNYIYDLDQGETLAVHASTDGKKSYWKAKARYKVDNKAWQEKASETVYLDENGIVTPEPAQKPAPDDREYYVSDFLQGEAQNMQVRMRYEHELSYDHEHGEHSYCTNEALFMIENEDEFNTVKDLFGEVKLSSFDMFAEEFKPYVLGVNFLPDLSIYITYGNEKSVQINLNDCFQDKLGLNLFLSCYDNEVRRYYSALIPDETFEALVDYNKKLYKTSHNINSNVTEWWKLEDLMQEEVSSAQIDMLLSLPHYDSEQNLIPQKRINFDIDGKELYSIQNILNSAEIASFDMEMDLHGSKASGWFNSSCKYAWYSLSIRFQNNKSIKVYLSNMYKSSFYINLYVVYNDGETNQYFTGLISNETLKNLDETTVNIYNKGE